MKLQINVTYEGVMYPIAKFDASYASAPERQAAIEAFYKEHPEMNAQNSKINILLVKE